MSDPAALDSVELQQQLDEKDQLIRALTDRLEEAAEQLDRVNRSGGNKQGPGGSRPSAAANSELASQQQTIIEHLEKSAELWDDLQPKDAFARVEERLEELRQLLESGAGGNRVEAAPHSSASSQASKPAKVNPIAGWEKMKADLMGEAPPDPKPQNPPSAATPAPAPASASSVSAVVEATSSSPAWTEPESSLSDFELPEPVDFDAAQDDELKAAIEARDLYIGELTRRLRSAESRTRQTVDWAQLNNAPDELRQVLERLEAELNDRLRIAEVDLSLERARLARVEARIQGMQKQIEDRLKAVGPPQIAASRKSDEPPARPAPAKSWFGSRTR